MKPAEANDLHNLMRRVAAEMFSERGRDGFKMRDLADRIGVSVMTPYRYFGNKEGVLSAVRAQGFARLADRLEAACASAMPPAERVLALSRAYAQFAEDQPRQYRLMFELCGPQAPTSPEVRNEEARVRAILGTVLWSSLHGVTALRLGGQIEDCDIDEILHAVPAAE